MKVSGLDGRIDNRIWARVRGPRGVRRQLEAIHANGNDAVSTALQDRRDPLFFEQAVTNCRVGGGNRERGAEPAGLLMDRVDQRDRVREVAKPELDLRSHQRELLGAHDRNRTVDRRVRQVQVRVRDASVGPDLDHLLVDDELVLPPEVVQRVDIIREVERRDELEIVPVDRVYLVARGAAERVVDPIWRRARNCRPPAV